MKNWVARCVLLAFLLFDAFSKNAVAESGTELEELVRDLHLRLNAMSLEGNEQIEQLIAEQKLLKQSVKQLSWVVNRADESMKVLEINQEILMENLSRITSQSETIMVNQQFCTNHDALRDQYFELIPRCQGPPLPPVTTENPQPTSTIPSTTTTLITTSTTLKPSTSSTTMEPSTSTTQIPTPTMDSSCKNATNSGVYRITLESGTIIEAFCQMDRLGGGWLVFQSRLDGTVDFNRSWSDYRNGFGDAHGEYWLGLENLLQLTAQDAELLIEMEDFEGNAAYARYNFIKVENEAQGYRLRLGTIFTGLAGDALLRYFDEPFSTYDFAGGNYAHCADTLASGFWHYDCGNSIYRNNLNGIYGHGKGQQGIWWGTFNGAVNQNRSPLKTVRMMLREL